MPTLLELDFVWLLGLPPKPRSSTDILMGDAISLDHAANFILDRDAPSARSAVQAIEAKLLEDRRGESQRTKIYHDGR